MAIVASLEDAGTPTPQTLPRAGGMLNPFLSDSKQDHRSFKVLITVGKDFMT